MVTYKASVEEHIRALEVVEEEFGLEWLENQAALLKQPALKTRHPIPQDWKQAKKVLETFAQTGCFTTNVALTALASFGSDLSKVRSLPNYASTVRPRLKGDDFVKVQYEVYVGALCVRTSQRVEFVLPWTTPRKKQADLKLLSDSSEIYVECVRKDAYQPQERVDDKTWTDLSRALLALRRQLEVTHEVVVFELGALGEKAMAVIPDVVRQQILHGKEGLLVRRKEGYGLAIRKLEPTPPGARGGIGVPFWQNPADAEVDIIVDAQGKVHNSRPMRIALYHLDSHRLDSIVRAFNKSRIQLPSGRIGLIYIDLDVSHVEDADVLLYLDFVAEALKTCFSPNQNTRVGAVVLTTAPLFVESHQEGTHSITLCRRVRVIRNPFRSLAQGFIVPGESL